MENVKTKIKEIDPIKMNLEFEIDEGRVASETESIYGKLQKDAKISGFRQGKAPMALVREKYDSLVRERLVENLVRDTLYPVLKEKNINLASPPVIEKVDVNKGMKYTAVVERHPEIAAKGYKGMKLKKALKKITDKEISKSLEELQKYNMRLVESKSNVVGPESMVVIDYSVWKDSEEQESLKSENQLVDVSQKQLLPGLAEGLMNAKLNEQRDVKTVFPENYPRKELARKEVVLKITVKAVKEKQLPQINEDFAKELGYATVEELKNKIKQTLAQNSEKDSEEKLHQDIDDNLISQNNISVPESLVKSHAEYLMKAAYDRLKYQGLSQGAIDKQKPEIEKSVNIEAQRQVKLMYITDSIAKQERIEVTGEDVVARQQELKKANPGRERQVEQYFQNGSENMNYQLKTEKIYKYILDNAKIKTENI